MNRKTELLAPAGEMEAAYAAFHYGADAIYMGLPRFSARAEAVNFTLDQVGEVVGYARSLKPRRQVFVTFNTLVLNNELADAAGMLSDLADCGVDAVIVQDAGVARILRRHLPGLCMHASTQMAVHSLAGARAAKELGFSRVTLARELTLDEVRDITAGCGIETETFIHGALCYSYSGLCLFSSMLRGRSGNRGKCSYPCRDACKVTDGLKGVLPFSMKDLALGEYATKLRDAGVKCFKIEGRMKSPLYVATVVNYYRKLLDGELSGGQAGELESHMKSVFARPWTRFFMRSRRDQDVVDRDVAGHRGVPIGKVAAVFARGAGLDALQFTTSRPIERHDGLQVDLPGCERPYGFAVDALYLSGKGRRGRRSVFEAQAGDLVEVVLPKDHPRLPEGAPVYCSSSQAVKRGYNYVWPKPGEFASRYGLSVRVGVDPTKISAAVIAPEFGVDAVAEIAGVFDPAKDSGKTEAAARDAFGKLGGTRLAMRDFACNNPAGLFVPVSKWNELRRLAVGLIEDKIARAAEAKRKALVSAVVAEVPGSDVPRDGDGMTWSIKTDQLACLLSGFEEEDWGDVAEVVVDVWHAEADALKSGLDKAAGIVGQGKVRLALPMVTRAWETEELKKRVGALLKAGWQKWQISNVSGWQVLKEAGGHMDVTVDWPVYVLNRQAGLAMVEGGANGFTCSPEDGRANIASLVNEFGKAATVIVYQDTPLFLSESCVNANLAGKCAGKGCDWEAISMRLAGGEWVLAMNDRCRTVVVNSVPYCLSGRLDELRKMGVRSVRVDFVWRLYAPEEVSELWRRIRKGDSTVKGYLGNFERGLA